MNPNQDLLLYNASSYVKDHINTVATQYVTIDKPRDFDSANNTTTNAPINFIQVTNILIHQILA